MYFLIALAFIDIGTMLLPDNLTYPLLWCGLLINLNNTFTTLNNAVIGAVTGYLLLWGIYWIFRLITSKEGMGYGDFKLMAALGAWFGWEVLPTILLLSSLIGLVFFIIKRHKRDKPFPFGPYLASAGILCLFL